MSKGTSKRIKRHMSQLIITGKPKKEPIKMKFNKASFNNTQRFSKRGTNDAMYEKDLQIQQADLIQMRSNADFLKDESAYLAKLVKEQAPLLNEDATDDDVASILNSFELLWFSHHGINHKYLIELAYLFEVTYQVGNQQSPKNSTNTADSWLNWWNKFGVAKGHSKTKQLVFNNYDPNDKKTLYFAAGMQKEFVSNILQKACRVNLRDKSKSAVNVDLTTIFMTDILDTYGVHPVCPSKSPEQMFDKHPSSFFHGLKYLLILISKCLTGLKQRGLDNKNVHYIDLPVTDGVIKSDTFFVGFDCEYVSHHLKDSAINSKVRDLDDVLSLQLYAINNKDCTKRNGLIIHNVSHQHFTQSELVSAIQRVIEPLRFANVKDPSARRATVHLLGYYSGVDMSCFAGWERFWNHTNTIVLKKNAPFSLGYVKKKLNDGSTMSIDITDMMNDAPIGGLKTLGEMVGIPKIDTEKFDEADGLPIGYYKDHMDVFRKKRPNDYNDYAMNDAVITLEYALFLRDTLGKIPKTTGSYAAAQVSKQRKNHPEQFLADPNRPLREYVESEGAECVRPGQADLYEESRKGLYGGHNVAYLIGLGYGRVLDFDLASAYNIAGHLLPILDYTDTDYTIISPQQLPKYMKKSSYNCEVSASFRIKNSNFTPIGEQMEKTSIFLIGIGKFKIDYPDNTEFIDTPSHSKTGAPIYVKHYEDWCTLLDAYNAWKRGASVQVITLRVPKQHQDGLNVFGDFQNREIKLRNASKAKMKHSKKNSPQYAQANGEQLLHKLTANSTYGKTLQGAGNKQSRDFDTYLMADTPKSTITDPLIGDNYTAFTRYLVGILYDASKHCSVSALQLNITTDGLSLVISPKANADKFIQEMTDYFNSKMEPFYFDRLALAGKKRGFELKANVVGHWFNIRTRVNGNLAYSKTKTGIFATASMMGQKSHYLFRQVKDNALYLRNPSNRLSNLTEMKFRLQNHYGSQEQFEQITNVSLGYDFAYKPVKLIQNHDNSYFTTVPYDNRDEHDQAKEMGGKLIKMAPMRCNQLCFNLFLRTLEEKPAIKRKLTSLKDRLKYQPDYLKYCHHHYLYDVALGILPGDLTKGIDYYCKIWKTPRESIKKSIQRVKAGKTKVNYIVGWYFKEVLCNGKLA